MPETGLPDLADHFIAYAGSAAIATAAYGRDRRSAWILVAFCGYAAILEYLQHFSPGRDPSLDDFVASAIGAICGGIAAAILWPRLWNMIYPS